MVGRELFWRLCAPTDMPHSSDSFCRLTAQVALLQTGEDAVQPLHRMLRAYAAEQGFSSWPAALEARTPSRAAFLYSLFRPKPSNPLPLHDLLLGTPGVHIRAQLGRTLLGRPISLEAAQMRGHLLLTGRAECGIDAQCEWLLAQQLSSGAGFLWLGESATPPEMARLRFVAKACGREHDFFAVDAVTPSKGEAMNFLDGMEASEAVASVTSLQRSTRSAIDEHRQAQGVRVLVDLVRLASEPLTFPLLLNLTEDPSAINSLARVAGEEGERLRRRLAQLCNEAQFRHSSMDLTADGLRALFSIITESLRATLQDDASLYHAQGLTLKKVLDSHQALAFSGLGLAKTATRLALFPLVMQQLEHVLTQRAQSPQPPGLPFLVMLEVTPRCDAEQLGRLLKLSAAAGGTFALVVPHLSALEYRQSEMLSALMTHVSNLSMFAPVDRSEIRLMAERAPAQRLSASKRKALESQVQGLAPYRFVVMTGDGSIRDGKVTRLSMPEALLRYVPKRQRTRR